jgi:hypothetical protein
MQPSRPGEDDVKNILIGVFFVIGGLSGSLVLRGTGSSGALAVVGLVLIVLGVVQLGRGPSTQTSAHVESALADRERDEEQWAEYRRARDAVAARTQQHEQQQAALAEKRAELDRLLQAAPHARPPVDALLERTKSVLDPTERLDVALETARRIAVT